MKRLLFIWILTACVCGLQAQHKAELYMLENGIAHVCKTSEHADTIKEKPKNYYCVYCGQKYPSVANLTQNWCMRHPKGSNKGYHELYQGSEKSKYTCKYCGQMYNSISAMTLNWCLKHPEGTNKGKHAPAL
jgi:hypothetical protein